MARIARVVVPGVPHHITQRGNRRLETFFGDADYTLYRSLLAAHCAKAGVAIWAYCLMPNHVHLVLVPETEDGLRRALGEAHRRYTRDVNRRQGWRGHLWQERFHSFPMDEGHLVAAVRYVELNPVRARLVARAADWPWSSARAHLNGQDDGLVEVAPMLERIGNWPALLAAVPGDEDLEAIRIHTRSGRPLGGDDFTAQLEAETGRQLGPRRRGRKAKDAEPEKAEE